MGVLCFWEHMGTIPFMFKDVAQLLHSPTRIKILKFFIFQPDVRATAKVVAGTIGVSQSSLEKEIRALVRHNIISARRQGKSIFYTVNRAHYLREALELFLQSATNVDHRIIADVFRGTRGLTCAVASGMLVDDSRATIDLLLVVRKKHAYDPGITRAMKRAEKLIALPLRYAVLEVKEFEERFEARDRLLRDVFEFPHAILFGGSPALRGS